MVASAPSEDGQWDGCPARAADLPLKLRRTEKGSVVAVSCKQTSHIWIAPNGSSADETADLDFLTAVGRRADATNKWPKDLDPAAL